MTENKVMDITTTRVGEDPSTLRNSITEDEMTVVVDDTKDGGENDDIDTKMISVEPVRDLGGDKGPT